MEQLNPTSYVPPSTEELLAMNISSPSTEELLAMNIMENKIKNAIRTALFNKISTHNPQLAKAIAYRSTHPHLFSSGDLASFYDNYGSYKKELQTYLASIKVEINNLLGDGELKFLYEKICYEKSLWYAGIDLFEEEPTLCH